MTFQLLKFLIVVFNNFHRKNVTMDLIIRGASHNTQGNKIFLILLSPNLIRFHLASAKYQCNKNFPVLSIFHP